MRSVDIVLALVVLATVVATLARRLRAPAPSLLVLAGLGVGLLPGVPDVELGPTTVSLLVLPPLLYAGASELAVRDLRRVAGGVAVLALGLVTVTALAVAVVVHAMAPAVSLSVGFVLGAVLASTDPVAVGALARRLQLPPRLFALVQGESLLNDATSLVLFRVALAAVAAGGIGGVSAGWEFVRLGAGGVAIGLIAAFGSGWLRRRTDDPVLTTVIALVTPYAAYLGAESLTLSGVTAVVVAGLRLGRRDPRVDSAQGRVAVATVYAVVVFLLESVVFALIGLQLPTLLGRLAGDEPAPLPLVLVITGVLLVVRVLWVAPTAVVSAAVSRARGRDDEGSTWRVAAVTTWAGTRGVVPLAAALSIPNTISGNVPFPHRDVILVVATGVIVLTLVVQGFTLEPLVRRLGIGDDPARIAREEAVGRHATALAARARLEQLLDVDAAPIAVAQRLRRAVDDRVDRTEARINTEPVTPDMPSHPSTGEAYRRLRRDLLAAEAAELIRLRDDGTIGEAVRRKLQAALDTEATGLD